MSNVVNGLNGLIRRLLVLSSALCGWRLCEHPAIANPAGGTVAVGGATFSTSGATETITTSGNALINWQSFNIGAGQTTTFVEPTASSVVWNSIGGGSPSQILGNLNANGYVILQNQSGFYVGGQASITAHGLIMTTANAAPTLSSGGAWDFDSPPPTAQIINYGQISTFGGGSAFLIADNIENNGTISAPAGKIGLYAGEHVLVSMSPDGRGLSAAVNLPQGSVDNQGNLIANGGDISAQAQTVNQNGLIQANTVQNVNGTIELLASDNANLGANSIISAQGDTTGNSSGGNVTIQSGKTFSDQAGSTINISGGSQGGNGGQVEISAPEMGTIQSTINGQASAGFTGGNLTIDPTDIWLASSTTDPEAPAGYSIVDVNSFSGLSQINLQADQNITLNTLWTLSDPGVPASLSLTAGNNITLNDGSGIAAGNNWGVNLSAGPQNPTAMPSAGNEGIYLDGSAYIQTENGNISLYAANEVQVGYGNFIDQLGNSGIRTLNKGNISVTTFYGDVNAGANADGYNFTGTAPYYIVPSGVGGISTADGGNVSINAGGNVISYLPGTSDTGDAGTGAFGSNPGNVSISAKGSVYGHYVLADGTGTITAGADIGSQNNEFALSLINGTWNINALSGDIYLQEVRNPNGDFNNQPGTRGHPNAGLYWFNYGPDATLNLDAVGIYLTGLNVPRINANIPVLYPPILNITAGAGGVTLENDVTLFPSVDQSLTINISDGGNLQGPTPADIASPQIPELLMSDSPESQWTTANNFGDSDQGYPGAVEPTDPTPNSPGASAVSINVAGNMQYISLTTTKETDISVGGNMTDCIFSGQNLHETGSTTLTVGGQISNPGVYASEPNVTIPSVPITDLLPGMGLSWDNIFALALDPSLIASLTLPPNTPES
ncbi:MAG: filamentous hemagglutinin N-terminal domain-containing protein, partial [Verrucomicrobiota bacterium]